MTKTIKRLALIILALVLSLSVLVACEDENEKESGTGTGTQTETESSTEEALVDFDYENADMSQYITISDKDYLNTRVTLSTSYIITDASVDQYIADERFDNKAKTNGDTQVTDQAIRLGDSAFIYYTGYLDGVAFEGGSNASGSKPYELSIGSGSFIPGFEEGLIGVIPANTSKDAPYNLNVTFPESYSNNPDLAGKAVVFKVWIEYVVQYTIPELTDDYVKNTVKYDGTVEEYRAHVKETLQTESDGRAQSEALPAIIESLMSKVTVKSYPQESVDYWYAMYVDQFKYYMQMYSMYGMSFNSVDEFAVWYLGLEEGDDWKAITVGYAKNVVKNIMIYYAIADEQGITVTGEEFNQRVKELAEYHSSASKTYTEQEIIEKMGEDTIRQNILMEKIDEFLIENCTIEYKDK